MYTSLAPASRKSLQIIPLVVPRNDGVVNHDDSLALNNGLDDVQLHTNGQFTLLLIRFNKGTAHVVDS